MLFNARIPDAGLSVASLREPHFVYTTFRLDAKLPTTESALRSKAMLILITPMRQSVPRCLHYASRQ